ncbi:MAG TPA: hypothetical protein VGG84_10195 [Gemmatimonadaceae bacterium]
MNAAALASPFVDDLLTGVAMAYGFSLIAAIPLGLVGILAMGHVLFGHRPLTELRDWALTVVAVLSSYALAAVVGSPIFAVCRPIRGRLWGSALTGALVAPVIFGSVWFMAIVMWNPAGQMLFGDRVTSRADFVAFGRFLLPFIAAVGLVAGPYMRARIGRRKVRNE